MSSFNHPIKLTPISMDYLNADKDIWHLSESATRRYCDQADEEFELMKDRSRGRTTMERLRLKTIDNQLSKQSLQFLFLPELALKCNYYWAKQSYCISRTREGLCLPWLLNELVL